MRLTNGVTREINLIENKVFLVEKEENACSNALSSGDEALNTISGPNASQDIPVDYTFSRLEPSVIIFRTSFRSKFSVYRH